MDSRKPIPLSYVSPGKPRDWHPATVKLSLSAVFLLLGLFVGLIDVNPASSEDKVLAVAFYAFSLVGLVYFVAGVVALVRSIRRPGKDRV